MISVIICSINRYFCSQVVKSITDTIGVNWEPVIVDNTIFKLGIASVYNNAALIAKYPILCFVHEDVTFSTKDWGVRIVELFEKDSSLGLIGVGGSKYKSENPSGWFTGIKEADCCNIRHISKSGKVDMINLNPDSTKLVQDVVVIDGVFMCSLKKVWEQIKFDDVLLKGFHLYDIDFSFRVSNKFKTIVIYDIDILHHTEGGNYGHEWIKYTLLWHDYMSRNLPFYTRSIKVSKRSFNATTVRKWLIRLKHENINLKLRFLWLFKNRVWKFPTAWLNIPKFILMKYINGSK